MRATSRRLAAAVCVGLLAAAPAARAAEATAEEAARLRALFEGYLGAPTPGEPSVVAVTPKGEAYELVLDFDRLVAPLAGMGVTVKAGRNVSLLTPLPDGTWKQIVTGFEPITYEAFGQTGRFAFENYTGDGVFDPRLGTFTSTRVSVARVVSEQTIAKKGDDPRFDIRKTDEKVELTATFGPAASGSGVDGTITQSQGPITQTFALSEGLAKGVPDMEATLKVAGARIEAALTGVKPRAMLELWAHLVRHHAPVDFTNGQASFKARIAALLPVFENLRYTAAVDGVELETPVGFGSMRRLTAAIDTSGATRDGKAALSWTIEGLELHSLFLPAWAARLIPADLALSGRISGYDLATPLATFLDAADFAAEKPLAPEIEEKIKRQLVPGGTVEIVVDGNRIDGPLWKASLDGRFTAGPDTGAKGAVTIRATGVEEAIAALSDPKAGAEGKKAAAELRTAVGFAEKKDDALVWRFDFEGDAVAVNGRPLSSKATEKPADPTPAPVPAEPTEPAPKAPKKAIDNKPKKI